MNIYGQQDQSSFPLTELLASKRTACFQEKRTTLGVFSRFNDTVHTHFVFGQMKLDVVYF